MIRAILTDVLLVGLEWNITMPQESITLRRNERTPNIQIENIENYKQKVNSIMRTKKQNTRTPEKIKIDITRRTQSIEKETEKQ